MMTHTAKDAETIRQIAEIEKQVKTLFNLI